jgi:hypothetical protein
MWRGHKISAGQEQKSSQPPMQGRDREPKTETDN